ncbi:enoyl-CoA hydratase/isomerase family protein [Denitrificimonas sp. JX-1]|uniref:3-hydroxyisobutyryl-CoA hydrolase n=1 Tax=Denitrificimonas halotolerans TaxID=3098930 RepID=A0ABU5GPT1_9GAMM|nr:enoyl-CoA hydratase/isomerase family protein [Denitrificimonas sp. JX-1]MDY7218740.1 enoyl-CoA hydratase/isomerase family protein [Denitrificimonas sp. JX-1]
MSENQALILTEIRNRVGHLTLNRVAAFNAINLEMVRTIRQQLDVWAADEGVVAVVLRANGDKAFCAGGDIRELYNNAQQNPQLNETFFTEEYALDLLIHNYPKPVIALINGLVLGGGMGLTQGASFRIITEKARLGMPEVSIGFFPDVGGSYFLSRLPGETGTYMGVSGNPVGAADALQLGLADWFLHAEQIPELDRCLNTMQWGHSSQESIRSLLNTLACKHASGAQLTSVRTAIAQHFAHNSVTEIITSLKSETDSTVKPWCEELINTLATRSPIAMATTLEMLRRGKNLSLANCFQLELHLGQQWFKKGDFMEGVRALIIDKDKKPQWQPATLDALAPNQIKDLFAGFQAQAI